MTEFRPESVRNAAARWPHPVRIRRAHGHHAETAPIADGDCDKCGELGDVWMRHDFLKH